MLSKKTEKGNLENKRNTFALIGLVLVLGLVYLCFELFATQKNNNVTFSRGGELEFTPETQTPNVNLTPPAPVSAKVAQEIFKEWVIRISDKDGVDLDALLKLLGTGIDAPIPDPVEIEPIPEFVPPPPIYEFSDVMPEYPGGIEAMYAFLTKHLTYPEMPKKTGIQGTSLIQFVVEKDGSVSNTTVLASLHPDCDNEAIRVIKMLKFSPGLVKNKPVRVFYMIPIQFLLQN